MRFRDTVLDGFTNMNDDVPYKRILLKVSGEALMGDQQFGIDRKVVDRVAEEVAAVATLGIDIAIVVGGGNLFRGADVQIADENRVAGHHMGMLATVMNCIAMHDGLLEAGLDCLLYTSPSPRDLSTSRMPSSA